MPEILIVEDNLLNLTVEADLLKSFGHEPKKRRKMVLKLSKFSMKQKLT
ncbi:response regulator [Methanosarcina barkeri]|nr:hypothetical protein [Methanosarcina barkeri]